MTNELKLEQQEIDTLRNFNQRYNALVGELGELSVMETRIQARKDQLRPELLKLDQEQGSHLKSIEDKYGPGMVDLESGILKLSE